MNAQGEASMLLSWLAPHDTAGHGYATVGKRFHDGFKQCGATILPHDAFGWDALVIMSPPTSAYMLGPHQRPDIVLHTMTETNVLPSTWVNILNRVGLAWVPSRFVERVFKSWGVTTPMICVGYGFDGEPVQRVVQDHFRVLAWGDDLHSRKNMLLAIQAFIAADIPNASLELKLNIGHPLPDLHWNDGKKTYNNITIRHVTWGKERLQEWLLSGDVGLYLSSGEGYGLMPGEMMRTGLPMISVRHTGLAEYMQPHAILEVESVEQPSDFFCKRFHVQGATEFRPSLESTVEHLRYASQHREWLSVLGMRGAASLERFSWSDVSDRAYTSICDHYGIYA